MAHKVDGGEYLTVAEAVEFMGCTDGWVRMLLRSGRLEGKRFGERVWLIPLAAAKEAKANLTARSVGKRATKKASPRKKS
jgi:excisionase family DNA binding protein